MIAKAELGPWSSVVGVPILLEDKNGEIIGQLSMLAMKREHIDETVQDFHMRRGQWIVDAINEKLNRRQQRQEDFDRGYEAGFNAATEEEMS